MDNGRDKNLSPETETSAQRQPMMSHNREPHQRRSQNKRQNTRDGERN